MRETVVGMFIPVYYREEKVRACLGALVGIFDENDLELHVRVGYNGGPPTLLHHLEQPEWYASFDTYGVYMPGNNVGKPKIVNDMVRTLAAERRLDYVISLDSDIIVQGDHWIRRFVDAFERCKLWRDLGALSAQQIGECCHVLGDACVKYKSADLTYTYFHPPRNEGVAGAAILTPYHVWRALGGYPATRIYANDDAHYALALHEHGLLMMVVDEVAVLHPPGDEPEYVGWKARAVKDMLRPGEERGLYG